MAPFIRFFREIAEEAHRAPPRTTLMTNAVATVPYWLEAIPGGVAHWIPYFARVRRTARGGPSPHGMTQTYQAGRSVAELGAKQPHELLLMLGGVLAILLSAAIYGITWATPPGIPANQVTNVVTILVVNVVLGGSLCVAAAM